MFMMMLWWLVVFELEGEDNGDLKIAGLDSYVV